MELLLTGLLTFASTNIDDILILAFFYSGKRYKENDIVAGQFLGIGALIIVSLICSLVGLFIPSHYIGLLGVIPIYLGVKALLNLQRLVESRPVAEKFRKRHSNIIEIAGITVANGGDNIAIYVPLFATLTWSGKLIVVGIFLGMTFLWCLLAKYLAKHPLISKTVDRYGHLFAPIVLILLGIYILYKTKSYRLFAGILNSI